MDESMLEETIRSQEQSESVHNVACGLRCRISGEIYKEKSRKGVRVRFEVHWHAAQWERTAFGTMQSVFMLPYHAAA